MILWLFMGIYGYLWVALGVCMCDYEYISVDGCSIVSRISGSACAGDGRIFFVSQ